MLNTLRAVNMLNGALVIAASILVFLTGIVDLNFTTATLACYIIAFGIVMLFVECNISNLQSCVRAQCGFLFSFWGRAIFITLCVRPVGDLAANPLLTSPRHCPRSCGTLCIALDNWVGYLFGSLTFVNAMFNMYCICVHPAFTSGRITASSDPYTSYVGGEKVMVQYLKENPDIARRAGASAVQFARDNPDVARQAAAGAATASQPKSGSSGDNPWA